MFLAVTAVELTLLGVPSVTTTDLPSAERTMVEEPMEVVVVT